MSYPPTLITFICGSDTSHCGNEAVEIDLAPENWTSDARFSRTKETPEQVWLLRIADQDDVGIGVAANHTQLFAVERPVKVGDVF